MRKTWNLGVVSVALLLLANTALSQKAEVAAVMERDARFWAAYNGCDLEAIRSLLAEDVEFYHDKGGPTVGLENFITRIKENICSDPGYRIRRVAVAGSVSTSLLKHGDEIYGAVVVGKHRFYVTKAGKERLNDQAEFVMLWLLKDNRWLAARIISYEHKDVKRR